MSFEKIRFESYDLSITVCAYYGLLSPFDDYPAVYGLVTDDEFEIGSAKKLCRRIYNRPKELKATHLAWVALKDIPGISIEDVRFVEATCIFAASRSHFIGRKLRNKQFTKTMGRFAGRQSPLQTVSYEFLSTIEDRVSA